jgi:hypothetical protein
MVDICLNMPSEIWILKHGGKLIFGFYQKVPNKLEILY